MGLFPLFQCGIFKFANCKRLPEGIGIFLGFSLGLLRFTGMSLDLMVNGMDATIVVFLCPDSVGLIAHDLYDLLVLSAYSKFLVILIPEFWRCF